MMEWRATRSADADLGHRLLDGAKVPAAGPIALTLVCQLPRSCHRARCDRAGQGAAAEMLPRLLNVLAARSGQVLNVAAAAEAVGMEKSSAENYLRLLEAVFLVQRLPAWGTTLGSRIARQPKIHVVDAGVMAWLMGLTPEKIAQNDPSVLTEYGHLVETFAVGEILKQVSWWDAPVAAGHFRTAAAQEVDLVLERDDGSVIAFEVEAGTRIDSADHAGIRALRTRLGGPSRSGRRSLRRFVGVHPRRMRRRAATRLALAAATLTDPR